MVYARSPMAMARTKSVVTPYGIAILIKHFSLHAHRRSPFGLVAGKEGREGGVGREEFDRLRFITGIWIDDGQSAVGPVGRSVVLMVRCTFPLLSSQAAG